MGLGGVLEFAFLASFWMVLVPLGQGPYFDVGLIHCVCPDLPTGESAPSPPVRFLFWIPDPGPKHPELAPRASVSPHEALRAGCTEMSRRQPPLTSAGVVQAAESITQR